ncbi:hypothetical protein [Dactylosporangium sp. CA-092794]|uniref:hypothetical protein n=1 Tax=Dactylosporangium sp. CA-092794 TaxID=3239929 RepID=UPI003D8D5676
MTVPKATDDLTDPSVADPADLDRRLRPRHWVGIGILAVAVGIAAFILPPLIGSSGGGSPAPRGAAGPGPGSVTSTSATLGVTGTEPALTAGSPGPSSAPSSAPPAVTAAPFEPISLQAEDPTSSLAGSASVADCDTCDGGARVRYIDLQASVTLHFVVPSAGRREITVLYELDGDRKLKVSINGGPPVKQVLTGHSWDKPSAFSFVAVVPQGVVTMRLYNDEGPAPDIDKVTIS